MKDKKRDKTIDLCVLCLSYIKFCKIMNHIISFIKLKEDFKSLKPLQRKRMYHVTIQLHLILSNEISSWLLFLDYGVA